MQAWRLRKLRVGATQRRPERRPAPRRETAILTRARSDSVKVMVVERLARLVSFMAPGLKVVGEKAKPETFGRCCWTCGTSRTRRPSALR